MEQTCPDSEDEDLDDLQNETLNDIEPENVVEFSISRAQTRLKDVATPATEKVRALHSVDDYIEVDPLAAQEQSFTKQVSDEPRTSPHLLSLWKQPFESSTDRASFSRAVLAQVDGQSRKRSLSGPTMLVESTRKLLPELPKTQPKKQTKADNQPQDDAPTLEKHRSSPYNVQEKLQRNDSVTDEPAEMTEDKSKFEDAATRFHSLTRPRARQRSNSDNDLYMKRIPTGASTFDEPSAFGDRSEQANARMKAITDSFRDSSFRLPRFSTTRFPSPRRLTRAAEDTVLQTNNKQNSGLSSKLRQPPELEAQRYNIPNSDLNSKQRTHPMLAETLPGLKGDIVVLGGYRGSILRSADPGHRQLWVPVKVGLGIRRVDLELGLDDEDEEKASDTIIPGTILSHIGPIDICRRLLRHARKFPNSKDGTLRVHDWGYDWRLNPERLTKNFISFLENLPSNSPDVKPEDRGCYVIAHSLGGLITRSAINTRPDLFAGVVYAGTPQHCVNILGPLRNGDEVLLSSRVLTAQVNFTIRTSFALLPESGRCFIDRDTGERYGLDFFDAKTYDEYRLSPCINPAFPPSPSKDKRRSLMDSISDSFTGSFPSMPKRMSFFGGSGNNSEDTTTRTLPSSSTNPGSAPPSPSPTNRSRAREAGERAKDTARAALDQADLLNQAQPPQSIQPTMNQPSPKPSVAQHVTLPRHLAYAYLERTLESVLRFKKSAYFHAPHQDENRYPPAAIIYSRTTPTVYAARVAGREAIKNADAFDDLIFAAGDGVVLASAAQLPEGYRCVRDGRVESDRGHLGLLGDLEGVGKALGAVVRARKKGVGLGRDQGRW